MTPPPGAVLHELGRTSPLPSSPEEFAPVADPTDEELRLLAILRSVRYGHVQIVKHEGRILTADPTVKIKFG